jgi:hypothetical protein
MLRAFLFSPFNISGDDLTHGSEQHSIYLHFTSSKSSPRPIALTVVIFPRQIKQIIATVEHELEFMIKDLQWYEMMCVMQMMTFRGNEGGSLSSIHVLMTDSQMIINICAVVFRNE